MRKTIRIDSERAIDWLIIVLLTTDAFRAGFNFILVRFNASVLSPYFTSVLMFLPLFLILITNRGGKLMNRFLPFLLLIASVVVYFAITLLFHPDYEQYIIRDDYLSAWYGIFRPDTGAIWAFLAFSMIRDPKRLMNDLRIAAYIMLLFGIYLTVTHNNEWVTYDHTGKLIAQSYNLNFGYRVMFGCIILLHSFLLNRKRWMDLLVAIGNLIISFSQGSRGALMCLAVYLVLYIMIRLKRMKLYKRIILSILIIIGCAIIVSNFSVFVMIIGKVFSSYTGNSRVIQMLQSGDLFSDNGRNRIYEIAWNAILAQGVFGNGAYGSRWIIAPYYFWGYPHNIVLELVMELGIIIGLALFVYLVYIVFKTASSLNDDIVAIMCLLIAMNTKLFVSDSFWTYGYFWAMLGFMYAAKRMKSDIYIRERDGYLKRQMRTGA